MRLFGWLRILKKHARLFVCHWRNIGLVRLQSFYSYYFSYGGCLCSECVFLGLSLQRACLSQLCPHSCFSFLLCSMCEYIVVKYLFLSTAHRKLRMLYWKVRIVILDKLDSSHKFGASLRRSYCGSSKFANGDAKVSMLVCTHIQWQTIARTHI